MISQDPYQQQLLDIHETAGLLNKAKNDEVYLYTMLNELGVDKLEEIQRRYGKDSGPVNSLRGYAANELLSVNGFGSEELEQKKQEIQKTSETDAFRAFTNPFTILFPFFINQRQEKEKDFLGRIESEIRSVLKLGEKEFKNKVVTFDGSRHQGSDRIWMAIYNGTHPTQKTALQLFLEVNVSGVTVGFYDAYNKKLQTSMSIGTHEFEIYNVVEFFQPFRKQLEEDIYSKRDDKNDSAEGTTESIEPEVEEKVEEIDVEDVVEKILVDYAPYHHRTASDMKPTIGAIQLATEMAGFLTNLKGDSPMQIGLFGRWGRGKTFMFEQIWKQLKSKNHFYRVDFHAWKHQETPASWGYLYEAFAQKYYGESNWFGKLIKTLKLNWKREGKAEVVSFLVAVLGGLALYFYKDDINYYLGYIGGSFVSLTALYGILKVGQRHSSRAKEMYKKYSSKHSYAALLGMQAEIQKELKTLLCTWIKINEGQTYANNRVLLFVDDIDRCSEDRIIQVVDSLRVMLEDPDIAKRVVVVVAVDERILRRAIRLKYERLLNGDLIEADKKNEKLALLTREYLDKLFLAGIKLGELNPKERGAIFSSLTDGKVEVAADSSFLGEIEDSSVGVEETASEGDAPGVAEEPKVDAEPVIPEKSNFELSGDEAKALREVILEFSEVTPRQIRIIYLRYLFFRDFLKMFKSHTISKEEEYKALIQILTILHGKDLFDNSIATVLEAEMKTSTKEVSVYWKKLSNEQKQDYISILNIVMPY